MDWLKAHDNIILNAKLKDRKRNGDVYYEKHHIVPKSLGGDNSEDNLVLLTAREHYIIHKLLVEIYPGKKNLLYAAHRMTYSKNSKHKRDYVISSREYERLRLLCSENISGENNPMYGKTHTPDAVALIIKAHLGKRRSLLSRQKQSVSVSGKNNPMYGVKRPEVSKMFIEIMTGKKLTEEHKRKIGAKQKKENNHFYGKSHTKESLGKMSKSLRKYYKENGHPMDGQKHTDEARAKMAASSAKIPRLTCPHCGKTSNPGNAKRWHFDNCRNKK